MLLISIIAIFIAGLMVGRTPEYLGKKIGARDLALHGHRMAAALPADGVWSLSASAALLGEHDAASIAAQPGDRLLDKFLVCHAIRFARQRAAEK